MLKHLFVFAITAVLFFMEPSFIKASTEDVSTSKSESSSKSTNSHSTNDTNCNGEGEMKCKGPNEFYDDCPPTCPPQTCESINQTYHCPLIRASNTGSNCKSACRCIKGYYRNNNNECISKEECLKCKGPNEFYDKCPPTCPPQTCDSINKTYNCPLIPASNADSNCKAACRCIKGYYRNKNNECISEKECPSCCDDPNAEPGCGANCNKHCDDIGREPGACATVCKENGCDCKDGYYLDNSTGKCVLPSQCTSCGGDPNAKPGCGVNCNKHCNDIGREPGSCIDICHLNACDCKDGYYLDNSTGKCVLPSQCTSCGGDPNAKPGCGVNCNKHCNDIGREPGSCIDICHLNACDCKEGYYLDDKTGKCVLRQECSTCGGDPNAVPGCSLNCNKQCSTLGRKVICPRIACPPNGCECKNGTYYNKPTKKCVLPEDCCPDQE